MSPSTRKTQARARLDDLIHNTGRSLDRHREVFWRLVNAVRASSTLLDQVDTPARHDWLCRERIVASCSLIAARCDRWVREPEAWIPGGTSQWLHFRSLLDHLFAVYPVPAFMTSAWLNGEGRARELNLYLHLAQGLSVRRFSSPFLWKLTKSAARWFMQAPDDLLPSMAFRWAQVRSLGGDSRLARSLLRTVLIAPTADERFLGDGHPISSCERATR
jgi:hypothetical protein